MLQGYIKGLSAPLEGAKLVYRHPATWKWLVVPIIINIGLIVAAVSGLIRYAGLVFGFMPQLWAGAAWWLATLGLILSYVAGTLLVILFAVLLAIVALLLGNILASPFHDWLSERIEHIMKSGQAMPASGWKELRQDLIRVPVQTLKRTLLVVVIVGALWLASLIPWVGPFFAVCAFVVSLWLLAWEYLDFYLDRQRYSFSQKKAFITKHMMACLGLGTTIFISFIVPLVGFVTLPLAVAGATWLAVTLDTPGAAS